MDFGYVLKRAWQIIWKFKVLWVFGILASCGQASNSAGSNSGYRFSSGEIDLTPQIEQYFNQLTPAVIALVIGLAILVILILVVLAILLGTVGRVGLIRGTVKAEQAAERLTFGELWRDGLAYFWRVFGLNLLIGVIIFGVILAIIIPGAILTGITWGLFVLCLFPVICLFIPALWAVSVLVEQANVALVVENLSIIDAIKRGWQVVRDNLGSMIVMSLILFLVVGLIGGAIIGIPLVIVFSPAVLGYAKGTLEAIRNGWIISGALFLIYLPVFLLLSGVLRAYTSSAWTLTFLQLTSKPSPAAPELPGLEGDENPPPAENG